jgi:hypothetical protein
VEVTARAVGDAEHHLGVDAVLGAAEGDEVDLASGHGELREAAIRG